MRRLPPSVRRFAQTVSFSILGIFAACGEDSEPLVEIATEWEVVPIPSPFAPGTQTPHLSSAGDGAVLSWWESEGDETVLRFTRLVDGTISEPREVTRGSDFFVNWADFPSISQLPSGRLVAHWLQRGGGAGTYDYGVRVSTSTDDGVTWETPWTPHTDGTPTEHGFVSLVPEGDDGFSLFWLDGRQFVDGPHGAASGEMTLRTRQRHDHGSPVPADEHLLDDRICDCCQTGAAWSSVGPIVTYRDRTEDEIRDIYFTLRDGEDWSEPRPIHDDGWEIAGCPVNGPAVDARGDLVVLAWFTGAQDRPRVQAKVSTDGGRSFGELLRLDHGNPVGRVDVTVSPDGRALVSWIEGTGSTAGEIRVQEVGADGLEGDWIPLASAATARASGFPRLQALEDGSVLAAWTDVSGEEPVLRLARLDRIPLDD